MELSKTGKHCKLLILGAGLTGLSAAYHDPTAEVFEKEAVVGGHGKTHAVNGFLFDEGIHVVHTTDKEVLDLYEKIGIKFFVKERQAWIRSHRALTRYPFQANIYGLPIEIVKECLLGFLQNDFTDRSSIKNYEDWLHFMFGPGFAKHFMLPYAKRFWGVEPKTLTTDWVDVRHPRPSLEEVIAGALSDQKKGFGVNAEFRYPESGGFGAIAEAFAAPIGNRLHLGMRATRIDLPKKQIEFNGNEVISYDRVLSTIPLPEVVRMLPDAPEEIRAAASLLTTNSILVVNLGVKRPNISPFHWIYYLEDEFPFFRISFPANFSPDVVAAGTSSIQAEVAYNTRTNPLKGSREDIVARVIAGLKRAGVLREDDEILFTHTIDIPFAYIIHDSNRIPAGRRIYEYLVAQQFYPCGRYGDWGYLWSHDVVLAGRDAVRALASGNVPHAAAGLCSREGCDCADALDL